MDEIVDERIRKKSERLSEMLNDQSMLVMALPDDEDYGYPVDSEEDIEALFRHLRGA